MFSLSTEKNAPRAVSSLHDTRLNLAVSCAQAMAIIGISARLVTPE